MSGGPERRPIDYEPPPSSPVAKTNWLAVIVQVVLILALVCIGYYWYFIRPIRLRYGMWVPF